VESTAASTQPRRGRERIYHTDALVLTRFDLGEADRILSVMTPRMGKLRVVAKGIRKPSSRFASHTELLALTRLTLAKGRELDVVTGAELLNGHWPVRDDLDALGAASHCAELVEQFVQERDSQPRLYNALRSALDLLSSGASPTLVARWFELTTLVALGFRPELYRCVHCERAVQEQPNRLSARHGGVLCPACANADMHAPVLSVGAQKLLRLLDREGITDALRIRIPPHVVEELGAALTPFTRHHLERDLRSLPVMRTVQSSLRAAERAD
jgi:DNA repair protein RecO (recombination protein O)